MTTHELEPTARRHPGLVSIDGRSYPLRSAKLTSHAGNGIAFSRLTQVFANPHDEPLEVVYTMPLPADGAVVGYTIRMGERTIRGKVEPRESADSQYRRALAEGRTAGLVEQERDDTFQQRLGNLAPGVEAEVEIEVLHSLAFLGAAPEKDGRAQWEFRFPTVVGVRYAGEPGRVKDAERVNPDRDAHGGIPVRLALALTVGDPTAGKIASPTHAILTHWESGAQQVELAGHDRLDRDLVIRWGACTDACGARLLVGPGLAGDAGRYGLVTVTPPDVPARAFTRDLTVLLDASGSMSGEPLAWAKEVVRELLESLDPGDRFELLAFATGVDRLGGPMRFATPDAVASALAALRKVDARGGTEMVLAIHESLQPLREDSQRQVVVVTDGQVGFEGEVAAALMNHLPANCRAHAVGVGQAPNRTATAGIARAGRGVEVLVERAAGIGAAVRRLCAATAAPVLTEVSLHGSAVKLVATRRIRDVFAGQPLLALLELTEGGGELEVRARRADSSEPWTCRLEVPVAGKESPGVGATAMPLGALFGREEIADLELSLAAVKRSEEVLPRIERVAMRHRITSRRTSLVAIAEEPSVEPGVPVRSERLAVELPAGVSAEGSGLTGYIPVPQAQTAFRSALGGPQLLMQLNMEVWKSLTRRTQFDDQDTGEFRAVSPGSDFEGEFRAPSPGDGFEEQLSHEERVFIWLRHLRHAAVSSEEVLRYPMPEPNERNQAEWIAETTGVVQRYLAWLREFRRRIDELEKRLATARPSLASAATAPIWSSGLALLKDGSEQLTTFAEDIESDAKRLLPGATSPIEIVQRKLRELHRRHSAANLAGEVQEVHNRIGTVVELP